jgi:hypothetical protein
MRLDPGAVEAVARRNGQGLFVDLGQVLVEVWVNRI